MLSPFFLSLAFLPLLLPFPYLNFPIPSFTFPTFPFLHIHPDFSTLLLTITFPLGLFFSLLPSCFLMLPPTPFCTSFSFLHISAFPSLLLLFQLLSLSSLWFSIFFHFPFLPFSHPLLLLPTFSLFLLQLFMFSPFLRSQLRSTFTPTYTFPTFFSALQFCHTFPPRRFPLPFFSPRFLTPTSFLLPFPHQLFPATFSSLFFRFCYLTFSYLHPLSMPQFFSYPSPFSSPRRFPLPSYLRPSCLPSFYALRTGKKSKNTIFIAQLKLLV